jgi:hypothetical protein
MPPLLCFGALIETRFRNLQSKTPGDGHLPGVRLAYNGLL